MENKANKFYIGDGVYAQIGKFDVMIYTDNGIEQSRPIYLELEMIERLLKIATDVFSHNGTIKELK